MRDQFRKNISVYDLLVKLRRNRNNTAYQKMLSGISSIDSIRNFDAFADSVVKLSKEEVPVEYSVYGNESYYYGYYHEFMNYAGIPIPRVPVFPRLEHGVRFGQPRWPFDPYALAYACQSPKRIREIWDEDPMKPVFPLGPYIHYARGYYDEETFRSLKQKLGKVLLVFPSHTAEGSTNALSESSFVDVIYNKYAPHFDTVVVCSYWRDTQSPVIDEFRKRGALLVSAGFRGDLNFIRRLKTIISLCDTAVGDDLGTNIGFCLNLNRPYYLEPVEEKRSVDPYFIENKAQFYRAFHTDTLEFTPEQLQLQQALYRDWWGGDEAVYSPEDANRLVKLMLRIYKSAHYRIDRIPGVIQGMLKTLPKTSPEYTMLIHAISTEPF